MGSANQGQMPMHVGGGAEQFIISKIYTTWSTNVSTSYPVKVILEKPHGTCQNWNNQGVESHLIKFDYFNENQFKVVSTQYIIIHMLQTG